MDRDLAGSGSVKKDALLLEFVKQEIGSNLPEEEGKGQLCCCPCCPPVRALLVRCTERKTHEKCETWKFCMKCSPLKASFLNRFKRYVWCLLTRDGCAIRRLDHGEALLIGSESSFRRDLAVSSWPVIRATCSRQSRQLTNLPQEGSSPQAKEIRLRPHKDDTHSKHDDIVARSVSIAAWAPEKLLSLSLCQSAEGDDIVWHRDPITCNTKKLALHKITQPPKSFFNNQESSGVAASRLLRFIGFSLLAPGTLRSSNGINNQRTSLGLVAERTVGPAENHKTSIKTMNLKSSVTADSGVLVLTSLI